MMNNNIAVTSFICARKVDLHSLQSYIPAEKPERKSDGSSILRNSNSKPLNKNAKFSCVRGTRAFRSYKAHRLQPPKKKRRVIPSDTLSFTRPCRRYLRRPANLVRNSRNSGFIKKLETHIWHTKRMVMQNIWGYRLGTHNKGFGIKALTKAFEERCILHDSSYLAKFELIGGRNDLVKLFGQIIDTSTEFFGDLECLTWGGIAQEYETLIYRQSMFPLGLLGPVTLSIRRISPSSDSAKELGIEILKSPEILLQIWLWVHPSISDSINEVLRMLAQSEDFKILFKPHNEVHGTHELSRLELFGNSADNMISRLLHGVQVEEDRGSQFIISALERNCIDRVWKSGRMLSVSIQDPRISREQVAADAASDKVLKWPKLLTDSIWSSHNLNQVFSKFVTTKEINDFKSAKRSFAWKEFSLLSPDHVKSTGSFEPVLEDLNLQSIPLILVRRHRGIQGESVQESLLGGWTIISPACYTMPLWMLMIKLGAVAAGFKEMNALRRHSGSLSFPNDYLDTSIGTSHWESVADKYSSSRSFTAKGRAIKNALGIFLNGSVAVVRNRAFLSAFQLLEETKSVSRAAVGGCAWQRGLLTHADWAEEEFKEQESIPPLAKLPHRIFCHIRLIPTMRGQPRDFAAIYSPSTSDIKAFVAHLIARKLKLKGDEEQLFSGNEWPGVKVSHSKGPERIFSDEGRYLLGYITSGVNVNAAKDRTVIGLCDASSLHSAMRRSIGRLDHPQSHRLVLFLNEGSNWLRPAIFSFL